MNIGKKIRSLRIQRGLTQKELAGEEITRNMLSRIENGAAYPSIGSLLYIAQRLDVSPAYFFDESEKTQSEIESTLCSYYNEGEYEKCISAGSALPASEAGNILAQCYLNIAVSDLMQMKYKSARESLLLAKEQCESAADITDTLYNNVMSILKLQNVSFDTGLETFPSDMLPSYKTMAANYYMFLLSNVTSCADDDELALNSLYGLHISARSEMSAGNYADAVDILKLAKSRISDSTPPALVYMIADDLEASALKTDDYKSAYDASRLKNTVKKQ